MILSETAEPDLGSVYDHSTDIVAMPLETHKRYVALVIILRARVQQLAACFRALKGEVEDVEP